GQRGDDRGAGGGRLAPLPQHHLGRLLAAVAQVAESLDGLAALSAVSLGLAGALLHLIRAVLRPGGASAPPGWRQPMQGTGIEALHGPQLLIPQVHSPPVPLKPPRARCGSATLWESCCIDSRERASFLPYFFFMAKSPGRER